MDEVADAIRRKLTQAFSPVALEILDESHLHAGHAGRDPRGESHFAVAFASAAFVGKGRVERQRMVYQVLADELSDRVHALRLSLGVPNDVAAGAASHIAVVTPRHHPHPTSPMEGEERDSKP